MKTLRQLLKEGEQRLLENQIENSTMEARYLLEYICDLNWAQYLLQADTEADPQEERRYQEAVERRCTHYPLLRSTVQKIVGDKVNLVNPAYETARDLKKLLERENLSNPDTETDPSEMSHRFYVSDAADKFNKFANSILPYDIDTTQEIPIEEY